MIFGLVGPGMNGSIGMRIDGLSPVLPPPIFPVLSPPLPLAGGGDDPEKMMARILGHFVTRLRAMSISPIHSTAFCWPVITLL